MTRRSNVTPAPPVLVGAATSRDRAAAPAPTGRIAVAGASASTCHAGEIVCLLGESGSGKSVIANSVMGLLPPGLQAVAGRIELQGEDLLQLDPPHGCAQLRGAAMAMVFQEPMTALNPVMTLRRPDRRDAARSTPRLGAAERRRRDPRDLRARAAARARAHLRLAIRTSSRAASASAS